MPAAASGRYTVQMAGFLRAPAASAPSRWPVAAHWRFQEVRGPTMVGIVVSCVRRAASKIHDFRGFIYLTTGKLWSGQHGANLLQRRCSTGHNTSPNSTSPTFVVGSKKTPPSHGGVFLVYPSGFEAELPLRSIFEPNAGDGAIDAKWNVRVNAGVEANAYSHGCDLGSSMPTSKA
jgi:hypothetical protein